VKGSAGIGTSSLDEKGLKRKAGVWDSPSIKGKSFWGTKEEDFGRKRRLVAIFRCGCRKKGLPDRGVYNMEEGVDRKKGGLHSHHGIHKKGEKGRG